MLVLSLLFGSHRDIGGNRASIELLASAPHDCEHLVIVLGPNAPNDIAPDFECLFCPNVIGILRYLPHIFRRLSGHELVIFDGAIPTLLFCIIRMMLLGSFSAKIVHHNYEQDLKRSFWARVIFTLSQWTAVKLADTNVWFSDRDAQRGSQIAPARHHQVALPIRSETCQSVLETSKAVCLPNEAPCLLRGVIPSNLNYPENISGLIHFYEKYRKNINNNIVITSPSNLNIDSIIKKYVNHFNDDIVSIDTFENYIKLLSRSSFIILPVYEGSGLQLKALDAFLCGRPVYASDFIKYSHAAFQKFNKIENIPLYTKNYDESIFPEDIQMKFIESVYDV
jgi:hypothetical protein